MQNVNFLLMLYFLRKYPVSCLIILAVVYLSFFRAPDTELGKIPHMDKVVHFCMYFGLSGIGGQGFHDVYAGKFAVVYGECVCRQAVGYVYVEYVKYG